jgi:threonine aldolase
LVEDHDHAQRLAEGVRRIEGLTLEPEQVDTNMLFFRVDEGLGTGAEFCARLRQQGLMVLATAPQKIRMVTHLDVTAADVERALDILGKAVSG